MYTTDEDVTSLEEKHGRPLVVEMHYELNPWEYDVVDGSMHDGRAHDVTMFIRNRENPGNIAFIRKPFFPPLAFRAPSGAARKGEGLERGAVRESLEETGLDVGLTRYIARINVQFTKGGRGIDWTSHIFEARHLAGDLEPRDTEEIAEARWATVEEIQGWIRRALIDANWDLFRYRVALTDLTVEQMEKGR